jgi:hypothetical protein
MTALATCPDLRSNRWTVLKDPKSSRASVWDIVPVLPTTEKQWMNSQSSYHSIQRLADGRWLAFLRGTSVDQIVQLGFATSSDGRKWDYFRENPVIRQSDGGGGETGIYRPYFVGYLGKNESGQDKYLLVGARARRKQMHPRSRTASQRTSSMSNGTREDMRTGARCPMDSSVPGERE